MLGETIGKYRIEALVGQGGMGSVYRVEHTVIGKRSAIKLLRREYGEDEEVVQRFFNEARAAARIDHPGIIDVYDFGTHQGQPYLVMEMLDGEPLSALLKRGRVEVGQARRLARQIAGALAAAHEHAITHRDLKPDNVFLVPDSDVEGGTRVKLLDFGIAKLTETDGSSSVETRTGAVIGTPVYMSPEQCRGSGEVDRRADLYSLGCILYEMLGGSPPFTRRGVGELITAHMTEPPEPLAAHAPGLDAGLCALVMRLLAKHPVDRLQSAHEVIRALDGDMIVETPRAASDAARPAADLPTLLPDDTDLPGPAGDPDRGAATAPAGDPDRGAATAPTAYPATADPGRSTLSGAASQHAARPEASTGPTRYKHVALAAALLGGAIAIWAASEHLVSSRESAGTVAPSPDATTLREPRLGLRHLDSFRRASGSSVSHFAQPGGWTSAASDFATASAQPGAPKRWLAAEQLCAGYADLHSGRDHEALEAMRRAAATDPDWDLAQLGLARALSRTGSVDAALAAARRGEALAPDWWMPIAEIANIHREADRLEAAVEEFQRALAMAPDEPLLLSGLALLYHAMHMDQAAAEYADRALAGDPDMLAARLMLAERALESQQGKTALEHAEHVLARQPKSPPAKLAQADALLLLGRGQEARDSYQRALELAEELGPSGAPESRFEEVRAALSNGDLPRPRHHGTADSVHERSRRDRTRKPPGRSKSAGDGVLDNF